MNKTDVPGQGISLFSFASLAATREYRNLTRPALPATPGLVQNHAWPRCKPTNRAGWPLSPHAANCCILMAHWADGVADLSSGRLCSARGRNWDTWRQVAESHRSTAAEAAVGLAVASVMEAQSPEHTVLHARGSRRDYGGAEGHRRLE